MVSNQNTQQTAPWVCLADSRQGRLLQCLTTPTGRTHVAELETCLDTWEGHEMTRPSPLRGKTGHSYASGGHEQDEAMHRFAKKLVAWLETQTEQHQIPHVDFFAPPRFLGVIRQTWHKPFADHVTEHEIDLTPLATSDLAKHPAIQAVIAAQAHFSSEQT
jgi:protein required for attachment to host cells